MLTEAVFNAGLRRYDPSTATRGSPSGSATTSSTTRADAVVRGRRVASTTISKRAALDCHASQFQARRTAAVGDAPEHAALPAARSRAATRSSARWPASGGRKASSCASRLCGAASFAGPAERTLPASTDMNIGIVCYASIGGSGIIATELGKVLAARGHRVHVLSSDMPVAARRLPARAVVPPRRDAELSAVPRAAVPAVARQQDRPGLARRGARHRPRALRDSARDGGLSGASDSRGRTTAPACPRSSRRCTAPTSRCSAAIARIRRSSRSASSSRTASPPSLRASRPTPTASSASSATSA